MTELLVASCVAIALMAWMCYQALSVYSREMGAMRVQHEREREAWAEERAILTTRIQDPSAGMALAHMGERLTIPEADPDPADPVERW